VSLDDKWRREQRAFRQLLSELLQTCPGQFVAIHEGCVVESGDDKIEVARCVQARFGYIPIFISRVLAGTPESEGIPSPRRLDGPTT
jgi:hypothetical protein